MANIRKTFVNIAIGLLFLSSVPYVMASSDNTSPSGDAIIRERQDDPFRKRMPSRNFLEISYSDGILHLDSKIYDGEYAIKFDNAETGESIAIPSIFVGDYVYVGLDCGIYNVCAVNSDGRSFLGTLEISF